MTVYTSGDWHIESGHEAQFVNTWHEFAQRSVEQYGSSIQATLLRDSDDPSHFVSFGAWPEQDMIAEWRGSAMFRDYMAKFDAMGATRQLKSYEIASQTELLTAAAR